MKYLIILGDGMADGVVVGPFGDLAAVQVGHRDAHDEGGLNHREGLEAVAEHHQHVRLQAVEGIGVVMGLRRAPGAGGRACKKPEATRCRGQLVGPSFQPLRVQWPPKEARHLFPL